MGFAGVGSGANNWNGWQEAGRNIRCNELLTEATAVNKSGNSEASECLLTIDLNESRDPSETL